MLKRILKYQIALFGNFDFPANADTTVLLLKALGHYGFMPQTATVIDASTGMQTSRLQLVKDTETIIFAPDRVDFLFVIPSDEPNAYVVKIIEYLRQLGEKIRCFTRIAFVQDIAVTNLTAELEEKIVSTFLPKSSGRSFEWTARWVDEIAEDNELYNYIVELNKTIGLGIVVANRIEMVDGIKVMHDVGTSPKRTDGRFNLNNIAAELGKIILMIKSKPIPE